MEKEMPLASDTGMPMPVVLSQGEQELQRIE